MMFEFHYWTTTGRSGTVSFIGDTEQVARKNALEWIGGDGGIGDCVARWSISGGVTL